MCRSGLGKAHKASLSSTQSTTGNQGELGAGEAVLPREEHTHQLFSPQMSVLKTYIQVELYSLKRFTHTHNIKKLSSYSPLDNTNFLKKGRSELSLRHKGSQRPEAVECPVAVTWPDPCHIDRWPKETLHIKQLHIKGCQTSWPSPHYGP